MTKYRVEGLTFGGFDTLIRNGFKESLTGLLSGATEMTPEAIQLLIVTAITEKPDLVHRVIDLTVPNIPDPAQLSDEDKFNLLMVAVERTFSEIDMTSDQSVRGGEDIDHVASGDGDTIMRYFEGARLDMSLVLSQGHRDAPNYPLARLWTEARIVRQRLARLEALRASLLQSAIVASLSKEGGKHFEKTLMNLREVG